MNMTMERETTTTKPTRIYRVWEGRLRGETLSRGLIRQWCNAIVPLASGYIAGGAETNLTRDEAERLVARFNPRGYLLDRDHDRFGREWIAGNWSRLWKEFERPSDFLHADQLVPYDTFRFVGWDMGWVNDFGTRVQVFPKYRAYYRDPVGKGEVRSFVYWWSSWQG